MCLDVRPGLKRYCRASSSSNRRSENPIVSEESRRQMQPSGSPQAPAGSSPPSPSTQTPAPAPVAPTRTKELADRIKDQFPDVTIDSMKERRLKATISPERIKQLATFVRDVLGFDHISAVSGTDYPAKGQIEIVYFIGALSTPGYED